MNNHHNPSPLDNIVANCCAFGGSGSWGYCLGPGRCCHTPCSWNGSEASLGDLLRVAVVMASSCHFQRWLAAFLSHFNMSVAHLVGVADWAGQKAKAAEEKTKKYKNG